MAKHKKSRLGSSIWQIANTIIPYFALWGLMIWTVQFSILLTLALSVLAGGLLVRVFIIFHDCGHGSFFRSRKANDILGFITGVMTLTPYQQWREDHAAHHATSGDLDRRGRGDIWTLTVQEYLESSRWRRFAYRLARNPFVLFVLAPFYVFVIEQRWPSRDVTPKAKRGVYWTNACIVAVATVFCLTIGVKHYLLIQLPTFLIAAASGIWLFYVQHQFEGVYWERKKDWDFVDAALNGSSFYKLPKVLQWFSGSIGFHHIHHLSPTIPNYNLERCHKETPLFQKVKPVTLRFSLKSFSLRLWDEQRKKLIGYRGLKEIRRQRLTTKV